MTPQQMFMLMQMQQAGKVASTPTPKIAQGPAPVQVQPAKEVQIQQAPQTEADKFKSAAKLAALNAGMSNAFKAGATKAAATNPMAAPLVMASMLFKEGDKVPETNFAGQTIDPEDPSQYIGMRKDLYDPETLEPYEGSDYPPFSMEFARRKGGQDFSIKGPGYGYGMTYIPELDMTVGPWQKYGYDYGRVRDMFLKNPNNRTSLNYQKFLWSHMTPRQRFEALQDSGELAKMAREDDYRQFRRPGADLYYSKGNKVKKPGYYNEGEEVEGGTPWWRLGPLARLFGKPTEPMVEAKPPPTPDDPEFNKGMTDKNIKGMTDKNIRGMTDDIKGPSRTAFEKHLDDMMKALPKKKYDRFMENFRKLGMAEQDAWLENREREFRYNQYQKELENDLKNARMSKSKAPDSIWDQYKKEVAKGLAPLYKPLIAPLTWPLAAAGTVLDAQPLNADETPEAVRKAGELQAAAYKDGPIISEEDQEYLMRKAFIEENNPQPVYKQHGGGTFDLEKVLNYIPAQYKSTPFNQAQPFMDQPYFQNVDSGSDNNSSFTDQAMSGNVNLWGPLSLDWNHGFGGQVGVGMDVPLMGGRPQWQ